MARTAAGIGGTAQAASLNVRWSVQTLLQLQPLIEQNAAGLGLDVVDIEREGQGLLRVFIERLDGELISIEDCERLSHQLTHVFEVENYVYERLEVSSPGIDRPLKKLSDFGRYAGQEATVKLRTMVGGRRSFQGVLVSPIGEEIGLEVESGDAKTSSRSLLKFKLGDVEKARLVPKIDFKRKAK